MAKASNRLQNLLVGLFGVTAFVTVTFFSFVWLSGLSYNEATGSFEQTSIIAIETKLPNVEVWLNGQKKDDSIPTQLRSLRPGLYELEIRRQHFHTYAKSFVLQPSEVGVLKNVVMIATKPLISSLASDTRFVDVGNYSSGLTIIDGELYDGTKFVTRFSASPTKLYRLDSTYVYLTGKEIRLFIPETNQDLFVYQIDTADALLNPDPFSYTISVKDGDKMFLINLIASSEGEVKNLQ